MKFPSILIRRAAMPLLLCVVAMTSTSAWAQSTKSVEPIVIGQSLPQKAADLDGRAEMLLSGATSYVDYVNSRGGIAGRPLQLITLNDENDPQLHAKNLRQLVKDYKAVAIINCVGDAICKVSATVAAELRVPLVGVLAGSAGLTRSANAYVFRIRVTYDKEAEAVARQLKSLGISRMAVVTDGLADSEQVTALQAAMVNQGLQSEILPMQKTGVEGVEGILAQLGKSRYQAAALDLRADTVNLMVEKGLDKRDEWPGMLTSLSNGTLNLLTGNFVHRTLGFSTVVPNPERTAMPLTQELQKAAELSGGPVTTSYVGLESYISVRTVAEALRRSTGRPDAEKLFSILDSAADLDIGGYHLAFAKNRSSGADFVDVAVRSKARAR